MVRRDRRQPRSFAELIAEPSSKFRVFDLLKSQPNRLAKNLPAALLGRALGRGNALCPCGTQLTAALGLSCLSDPLRGEHDFCLLPREARSAVNPIAYNLSGVRFGRPIRYVAMSKEHQTRGKRKRCGLPFVEVDAYGERLRGCCFCRVIGGNCHYDKDVSNGDIGISTTSIPMPANSTPASAAVWSVTTLASSTPWYRPMPLLKWRRAGDEPRSCTHHALD
jgi:hypothetical protein